MYTMDNCMGNSMHSGDQNGSEVQKGGMNVCMLKLLSHAQLFAAPWTIVHWASLSMEFSRQEYRSGCPFLFHGIFPIQGSNTCLLCLLH